MMNGSLEMMLGTMSGMMAGMGLIGLLVPIILVLAAAALTKYLFVSNQGGKHEIRIYDKHGI